MKSDPLLLRTERLDIIAATADHLRAELEDRERFARMLGAVVPTSWPPGEYDRDAQEFFLERLLQTGPSGAGWFGWYAVRRATGGDPPILVAGGGYFGPPGADGTVEIGYSVVPEWAGHGYATELSRALLARAAATPGVRQVVAHTRKDNVASIRVLAHCGFVADGDGPEAGNLRFAWDPRMVMV
jgi:ribosomal-protein-alanine N-acetyltransferase